MADVRAAVPIIRGSDEGERRWFYGGGVHTWKATADETGGAFLLFEDRMDRGKMTPLHTHPDSDETMYVLEGEILFHLDGDEHRIAAGGLAVAPRGVPHAFLVISEVGASALPAHAGLLRGFLPRCQRAGRRSAPATGVVDFGRVRASAAKNGGIEILGPPPFAAR